jgi:hypothetical protein
MQMSLTRVQNRDGSRDLLQDTQVRETGHLVSAIRIYASEAVGLSPHLLNFNHNTGLPTGAVSLQNSSLQ